MTIFSRTLGASLIVLMATSASAQPPPAEDTRTQYPAFLANSYFSFNVGLIGYLFSTRQLEPGFQAESVDVPRLAARVDLFGHRFSNYFGIQATYMRPVQYVTYRNLNGTLGNGEVAMAYGGITLVANVPLTPRVSAYGEGGGGVTSRTGLVVQGTAAVQSAHYLAGLLGAGLSFHATPNLDLMLGATYSPGRESFNQPSTRLFTSGIRYQMRPLPEAEVESNRESGFLFPENVVRLALSSNFAGYAVNDFFSQTVPVFWGGRIETEQGITLDYERNVFHTRKRFAFDLGTSASAWKSNLNGDVFETLSAYPLFRFFLLRTEPSDFYLAYSLAGPTYISDTVIDGRDTGEHFTFQDFAGIGAFLGKGHRVNMELGIKHYSNGNIFTTNPSIKIPLTMTLGWVF